MDILWQFEIQITLFLQQLGGWLVLPMKFFSALGMKEFFMLVMPAIYWCVDSFLGLQIALMLLLSTSLNSLLKITLHDPRPYWFDLRVKPYLSESTFGMPSGHAQIAASVWGLLAAKVNQNLARAILIIMIFFIGLSRIFLGVHFTSDVLIGWLIGALLVIIFIRFTPAVIRWAKQANLEQIWFSGFLISIIFLVLFFFVLTINAAWSMPESWSANAAKFFPSDPIEPFSPDSILTTTGTLFGIFFGAAWLNKRRGQFAVSAPIPKLFMRYLLGLAGILLLWYGLGSLFPSTAGILDYSLRYLRYTLIGLWVSAGAPLLFVKLHLAQPFNHHQLL